jgi:microcystin-dependent protein
MAYSSTYPSDNEYVKNIPAAIRSKGEDVLALARVPAGMVMHFAGADAPSGWLVCDGSAVARADYADLFSAIGTGYGAGDGSTTFNLPDLRGEFLRGLDSGRGVDADRALGSAQGEAYKSHTHTGSSSNTGSHTHTGSVTVNSDGAHTHTVSGTAASNGAHVHRQVIYRADGNGGYYPVGFANVGASSLTSAYIESAGAHTHTVSGSAASNGAHTHTGSVSLASSADHTHAVTVAASGGAETRPRNVAMLPCIKV